MTHAEGLASADSMLFQMHYVLQRLLSKIQSGHHLDNFIRTERDNVITALVDADVGHSSSVALQSMDHMLAPQHGINTITAATGPYKPHAVFLHLLSDQ